MPTAEHINAERINAWTRVEDYAHPAGWSFCDVPARARAYCRELEAGQILFFPGAPFDLPQDDCAFLISQKQTASRFHKNISYRPKRGQLRGVSGEKLNRIRSPAARCRWCAIQRTTCPQKR